MNLKQELEKWLELQSAADAQWEIVKVGKIAESGVTVGDIVRIGKKTGRVNRVEVRYSDWGPKTLEAIVYAYPFKKDGTVAKIGEFRAWYGEKMELVEKGPK